MENFTRELMYGQRPVRRSNPKPGESEYYYLDPRGATTFDDMKQIDVPSKDSPNPLAEAIQNDLYANDEYNYRQLYGDTPPQKREPRYDGYQITMPQGSQYQITTPPDNLQDYESTSDKIVRWADNFADGTEAAAVGYTTGATLGNFDEMAGAATAALTLNRDNYKLGRNATRKLQNDLQQRHPYIYGSAEFVGAMTTPMHLVKDTTFANKAFNALTDTISASAGYADDWDDFGTNLAVNGAANMVGLTFDAIPILRTLGSNTGKTLLKGGKKFIKQGINSVADKMKNMYYKENEDEEKYY